MTDDRKIEAIARAIYRYELGVDWDRGEATPSYRCMAAHYLDIARAVLRALQELEEKAND